MTGLDGSTDSNIVPPEAATHFLVLADDGVGQSTFVGGENE